MRLSADASAWIRATRSPMSAYSARVMRARASVEGAFDPPRSISRDCGRHRRRTGGIRRRTWGCGLPGPRHDGGDERADPGHGALTGLITSAGFRDLLEIRRQMRPSLYDLQCDKPDPVAPRWLRFEVPERLRHNGRVKTPHRQRQPRPRDGGLRAAAGRAPGGTGHPGRRRTSPSRTAG